MTSFARNSSTSPCRRPISWASRCRTPTSKWNKAKDGHDFGEVDWEEFYAVVRGEGPVAKERMKARREAWDDGAWVRDAAAAYEAKRQAKAA